MSNRKQRRAVKRNGVLNRAEFDRELRRVIDGVPGADPVVAKFWNEARENLGIEAAIMRANGDVSVLRSEGFDRD